MKRLVPVLKDYFWGGYKLKRMFGRDNGGRKISESWEVSVHPDGESACADGKLRPLHIEKAVDVIDFHAFRDRTGTLSKGSLAERSGC